MIPLLKKKIAPAAAIGVALLGVLPSLVVSFAVKSEYGVWAGMSWLALTLFVYIGICWRHGLLERGYRDYLWFRLVFLFAAGWLVAFYRFVITSTS